MLPRNLLPMRAVLLVVFASVALVAVGATSPMSAAADDLDAARARLEELRTDLESVADRYVEVRAEVIRLNEMMDARVRQVERRAKTLLGYQKDVEALAVELYKDGASVEALEGVLSSETVADMNRTTAYLEFSGEDQQRVIENIQHDTGELEHELDLLDEQRGQAEAALEELEGIRTTIETNTAEVGDEVASLEEQAAADRAAALAAEQQAAQEAAQSATQTILDNPVPTTTAPPSPSSEADWDAIAMCESGGNWRIDSTYDGGLQFHPNTWLGYGGGRYARYAWQATKDEQIAIAERVLDAQGPGAWPNCFQWK